jgi:hypothetical protein
MSLAIMSSAPTNQLTRDVDKVPEISVGILIGIILFGLFIVGYDQGISLALLKESQLLKSYGCMNSIMICATPQAFHATK